MKFLIGGGEVKDAPSLNNVTMQLRKCCNHPFLLNGVENKMRDDATLSSKSEADILSSTSGKLMFLDKLLPKLESEGHRVLIFSQFKIMLDVIEDYLIAKNCKYERIDGSITGLKRQAAIDRFQAVGVTDKTKLPQVMLLSTKAGGVGITLTAADTCIIFDSDWNPQNDIQAMARCHRIGQTKQVKIFRLITKNTYEQRMFQLASRKLGLEQAVMQGVTSNVNSSSADNISLSKTEIEKLLKEGAYDAFANDDGDEEKGTNCATLEEILAASSEIVHENTGSG